VSEDVRFAVAAGVVLFERLDDPLPSFGLIEKGDVPAASARSENICVNADDNIGVRVVVPRLAIPKRDVLKPAVLNEPENIGCCKKTEVSGRRLESAPKNVDASAPTVLTEASEFIDRSLGHAITRNISF
jgi:hypothetical protein